MNNLSENINNVLELCIERINKDIQNSKDLINICSRDERRKSTVIKEKTNIKCCNKIIKEINDIIKQLP